MYKAYVDGSCLDGSPHFVGYATVIRNENNEVLTRLFGRVPAKDVVSYNKVKGEESNTRNIAGEISSVVATIKYCLNNNIKEIKVHNDYTGLEYWATGKWKCNTDITARYKALIDACRDRLKLTFKKIKAHQGLNREPDELAQKGALLVKEDTDIWPLLALEVKYPKRKEPPPFIPDLTSTNPMAKKPASIKQLKFLKRLGCKDKPGNMEEAHNLIEAYLKKNAI